MKIKRILSIAIIIAMAMALCPLVALAQVPEDYEIYVSSFSVKPVSPGVVKAVFNTKSGNLTSGVWTVEYDFMRRGAANCNIAVLGNNPGIGAFFAINPAVVGGAPYTWYGTSGGQGPMPITKDGTNVAEPAVGEWHSVKMVVNLDSDTYTSYYDDADPNERPFTYEYIASLEFGVDSGAFDVKNLRLYQGEPADGSMIDAVYPINVQSAVLNSGASASAEYTFMPTTPITSGKWVLETEFKMSGAEGGNFAILHDMGDGTIEQTRFGFSGGSAYIVIPGEGPDVIPDYPEPAMNAFHTMIFEVDLDNKTFHFDIDGHTKDKTYLGADILGFMFCVGGTSTTTVNYLSLHEPIGEITPPEASNAVIVGNPVVGQPLRAIYDYEGFEYGEGNSKIEWLASDAADGIYNVAFSGQNFGLNSFMADKFVKARVTPKNMFNVPGEPTESLPVKVKGGLNTPVIHLDFETPHTQGELLADGYNNTLLDGNEGPWNSSNTFCTQDGCLVIDRAVDEGQTRLDRPLPVTGGKLLFAVEFHSTCPEFIFEISTPVSIFTSATIRQDSITVLEGRGGAAPGTYRIPQNADNNLLLFEIDTEANSFSCSYNGVTCFTGAEIYLPAEGLNGFYVNPKGTGTLYIEDVTVSRVSEAQPETGVEVTELTMTDGKALA